MVPDGSVCLTNKGGQGVCKMGILPCVALDFPPVWDISAFSDRLLAGDLFDDPAIDAGDEAEVFRGW